MSKQKQETGRKAGFLQTGILMLIGAIIGGGGSLVFFLWREPLREVLKNLEASISLYSAWALIALSVLGCITGTALVLWARRKYKNWDREDEEEAERIEKSYERYQAVISLLSVVGICVSGIVISQLYREEAAGNGAAIHFFVIGAFWNLICLDRIVNYMKKLNPERKGNIFSWNYDKECLASCDEREKVQVFHAGYQVYLKSQYLYLGLFVALILLSTILDLGIAPFLLLLIIWCSQTLIYAYYCRHYKK